MTDSTEAELMRRMASGDRSALAPFYDRFAPLVYPIVLGIVRDPRDASAVAHDVFWDAWQLAGTYDAAHGTTEEWIVTLARTRAMDRLAPEASGGDGVTSAVDAPESSPLDTVRSSSRLMPPSEVREALLNRLDATAPPGRGARRRRAWLTWLVVTAVVTITAAALTGMYVAGRYEAKLGQMARETASARERLRASEAMLRQHAALSGLLMDLLRDPATNVIALRGPSAQDAASSGRSNGSATGRVVWNATRGGVVAVTNLPLVPEGKVYELWAVTAATPRRVALFDVDAAGHGQQQIAAPALGVAVDSFMVTLEAAGGGVAPAGATVLTSR